MNSGLCKWSDYQTPWYQEGLSILGEKVIYHRKQWELVSCLMAFKEIGMLSPGKRGLGFGCGREVLPSIFAARGCEIVATDQSAEQAAGWAETNQHAANLEALYHSGHISREDFDARVSFRCVDMNHIPEDLKDFDFVWSICAFEHLGSIEAGLNFVKNASKCLKPGGWAFHTTEYNCSSNDVTQDHTSSVFFRRKDLQQFGAIDWELGHHEFDKPVHHNNKEPHLKIVVNGHVITCVRLFLCNN